MKPEDMNTINPNGKAFSGNRGALIVAGVVCTGFLLAGLVEILKAIF
jgi:hypothetical protein